MVSKIHPDNVIMSTDFIVLRNLALVGLLTAGFFALWILLARDWVKSGLRKQICEPVSVKWIPFANLLIWRMAFLGPGFKVIYRDYHGLTHRAYCWVSLVCFRKVTWVSDEVQGLSFWHGHELRRARQRIGREWSCSWI
jgi:hypothetical protein